MTDHFGTSVVFREIQPFRTIGAMIPILVVSAGVMAAGVLVLPNAAPGVPSAGLGPAPFLLAGGAVVSLALAAIMYVAKLVTEVRQDGLFVRLFPFHLSFRRIPIESVRRFEVKTYRPLRDYRGWGIRSGATSDAYTVSGDRGVSFTFIQGRDLLIGSQRPEELARAVEWFLQRQA